MEVMLLGPAAPTPNEQADIAAGPPDEAASEGGFELLLAMALEATPLVPGAPLSQQPAADLVVATRTDGLLAAAAAAPRGATGAAMLVATSGAPVAAQAEAGELPVLVDGTAPVREGSLTTGLESTDAGRHPVPAPRPLSGGGLAGTALDADITLPGAFADGAPSAALPGSPVQGAAGDSGADRSGSEGRAFAGQQFREIETTPGSSQPRADVAADPLAALAHATPDVRGVSSPTSGPAPAGGAALIPQLSAGLDLAVERQGTAVHLQLQPEGLGSVDLRVTLGEAGLAIQISVDEASTRDLVQSAVGQLSQGLEGRGLSVAHLIVDLSTNLGGQDSHLREPFGQSGTTRHTPVALSMEEDPMGADATTAASRIDYRV
jgi:hypothetical protein